jgi:CubicO group peptidase (beta-lactamase class C family)
VQVPLETIADMVEEAMSVHGVPGVAIGWSHDGEREFVCRGVTSIDDPLQVTPSTRFQVGSVTKTLTAAALLTLVLRREVDLDAPVVDQLPDALASVGSEFASLTPRLLLSHRCGLYGDWNLYGAPDFGPGDDALGALIQALVHVPFVIAPDVAFSYSNTGYCLAGHLVAAATKSTYEHAIAQLILQPAGLGESTFSADEAITHRVAIGHHRSPEGVTWVARGSEPWSPQWAVQRATNPCGGLISTAVDQLTWAEAMLGRGQVPDPQVIALMLTVQCPAGGQGTHTGLGWHLRTIDGAPVWSHNGMTDGYVAHTLFVPDLQLAATILTNHSLGGILINAARRAILDAAGLHQDAPVPTAFDSGQLDRLSGTFADPIRHITIRASDTGSDIDVVSRNDTDMPYANPYSMTAAPIERGRLLVTGPEAREGTTVEYDTDHETPRWVRLRGRVHPRT